jgi:tetratricopeptide (TPR) repeat protein
MMRKRFPLLAVAVPIIFLVLLFFTFMPANYDSLGWRVDALKADIKYALNPPEQRVFVPNPSPELYIPTATPSPTSQPSPTAGNQTATFVPTPTFTPSPTPLPGEMMLSGFVHEYQMWNNCGPANLSMGLSFWEWEGTQRDTAEVLKPNQRDKNVMPYELGAYVNEQTEFNAVVRVGGDPELIKEFVAMGFPVIVEKGFEGPGFDGWMGHYEVIHGYDDALQEFYAQDSYKGPDLPVAYDEFLEQWRAFNFTYLVIYPSEHETVVMEILGEQANKDNNFRYAEEIARQEMESLSGRDLFFALYNLGTNLVNQTDYTGAATYYDAVFANYSTIPSEERPWRILWYQTGPYFAYYYTGRYQDVIDLATTTLQAMSEPILEESYYWRAKAKLALGDEEGATEDFLKSLEAHPEFTPSLNELRLLGVEP